MGGGVAWCERRDDADTVMRVEGVTRDVGPRWRFFALISCSDMFSSLERRQNQQEGELLSVRVLVLGDSTVGKTSLIDMITSGGGRFAGASATDLWTSGPESTCGCNVSICRETVEVDMRNVDLEVELCEVGGAQVHSRARPIFYDGVDG